MKSQYAMILYPQTVYSQDSCSRDYCSHAPCSRDYCSQAPCSREVSPEDKKQIIAGLKEEGFLGEFFSVGYDGQEEQTGYLIGDNFLKLITFLGCSLHLAVTIPENSSDWKHFCHIEIQQYPQPRFFKGLNIPKCSCPQCKSRIVKSLPEMDQWQPGSLQIVCPKCQQTSLVEELNWCHSAAFSSLIIIIHSVYPSEAIPTEKIMKILNATYLDEKWDYFYYEQ